MRRVSLRIVLQAYRCGVQNSTAQSVVPASQQKNGQVGTLATRRCYYVAWVSRARSIRVSLVICEGLNYCHSLRVLAVKRYLQRRFAIAIR